MTYWRETTPHRPIPAIPSSGRPSADSPSQQDQTDARVSLTSMLIIAGSMIFTIALAMILVADLFLGMTQIGGFAWVYKLVPYSESCHP